MKASLKPSSWLREVTRLKPAKWNFRISIRAMLSIAGPMTIGWLTGTMEYVMWIAMGAMFPSIGEREAPYGVTLRKILISAPIGVCGFLMGYLGTSGLDWGAIVLIMGVVAFIAAILSSLNAAVSVGCMQFMVMSAVSLGNPELQHFWQPVLLMLCGSALYLTLFLLESLLLPHHVYQDATVAVLRALRTLAEAKAKGDDIEPARSDYNVKYDALYTMMLQSRYQALGHNHYLDRIADILQAVDGVFSQLIGQLDAQELTTLRQGLDTILQSATTGESFALGEASGNTRLDDLARALQGDPAGAGIAFITGQARQDFSFALRSLIPGPATLRNALALGLCTCIGYSVRWLDDASHWYWVPMTVSIVMKPELGSIFARAVQRTIGTAAGVVVGGIMLHFVPIGPLFLLIIAAIVFVMPWLSQKNYALCAFALTPMVLALLNFMSPDPAGAGLANLRLVDTAIGCAIVLIFGYLIWPKRHVHEFSKAALGVNVAISRYLDVAMAKVPEGVSLSAARIAAYGAIVDMRATLQKGMSEPPPAGYEAVSWFPLVAAQARLCDAITAWSGGTEDNSLDPKQSTWLKQASKVLQTGGTLPDAPTPEPNAPGLSSNLCLRVEQEYSVLHSLYGAAS